MTGPLLQKNGPMSSTSEPSLQGNRLSSKENSSSSKGRETLLRTTEPLLQISGITLGFDAKEVLHNVTMTVGPTDFLVLRGPNGGGKTTLLRLMAGLLRPDSGRIVRRHGLRIGYLPQYRRIDRQFPITVGDVVLSGLEGSKPLWRPFGADSRARAAAMLERMSLTDLAAQSIDALSGGQWQRTLLARALVGCPDLLLLDEPDSHLDSATKALLYAVLSEEAGQRAIVIVSHDAALEHTIPSHSVYIVSDGNVLPQNT